MCLIVLKPEGKKVTPDLFTDAELTNNNGAGFAIATGREIILHKGYFNADLMWQDYLKESKRQKLAALLHWRFATHGDLTVENTQPFALKHAAFAHNGIITWLTPEKDDVRSDSRILAEEILQNMRIEQLQTISKILKRSISWSRLAFLFPSGKYLLIEGTKGSWDKGVWYSNKNHEGYDNLSWAQWPALGPINNKKEKHNDKFIYPRELV